MSNSDYCTADQISANPALVAPCGCLAASNALQDAISTYKHQLVVYTNQNSGFLNEKNIYKTNLDAWNVLKDNQNSILTNQVKLWNYCIDANSGYKDNYCTTDIGAGWYQTGWDQGSCGLYRKGKCQRTANQVTTELNTWISQNPPPAPPVNVAQQPIPPSGNNIECCSQVFSGIDATNVNFNNISQNCSQTINNQIGSAINPVTTPTTTTPTTTTTPSSNSSTISPIITPTVATTSNKSTIFYIILISGFILFLIIIILLM
jgi:hypothetical protein